MLADRIREHDHIDAAALEQERTVRLPEIFSRLRNRTLSNSEYEELFRKSIGKILVFDDKVEFHTAAGNLTIPRLHGGRRKFFPEWHISNPGGDIFGTGRPPIRITFLTRHPSFLLKTDQLVFMTV